MVRPGYKPTEIGEVPLDWEVRPLGRLIKSVEYGSSAKSSVQGTTPVLRMGNLQGGRIDWNDLVFTSDERETQRYLLRPGDVLFNRTNTVELVGKTSIYRGERPAIFAGYLIRINVDESQLSSWYLNYVLNTAFSRAYSAKVLSVAIAQANINAQKLRTYPIPVPPTRVEQDAIAGALSDADALIEALERLLAKKRQIKLGAMQELLSGGRRLAGFKSERRPHRVGTLGVTYGGLIGKTKADFGRGSSRYITFMNIMSNVVIDCAAFLSVDIGSFESQNRVVKGDLFFNGSSETPDEVGMCALLDQEVSDVYLNSFCFGFRLRERAPADGLYLAYYFRSSEGREHLKSLAQGATRYNLSKTAFLGLNIPLPDPAEQSAIATILSDMDAEIDALEARLTKARQIKQGMMQELLTGRIRLV